MWPREVKTALGLKNLGPAYPQKKDVRGGRLRGRLTFLLLGWVGGDSYFVWYWYFEFWEQFILIKYILK